MSSEDLRASLIALTPMNPAYQRDPHDVLRPLSQRCPVVRDDEAHSAYKRNCIIREVSG